MEANNSAMEEPPMSETLGPYLIRGARGPVPNPDLQAVRRILYLSDSEDDHKQADILGVLDELADEIREERLRQGAKPRDKHEQ